MGTDVLRAFRPATQAWFDASFAEPTEVQSRGWEAVRSGAHALLVAPTGSGKTLAAFLAGIDSLLEPPEAGTAAGAEGAAGAADTGVDDAAPDDAAPGVRVLYVSPLKALVYDVERNLRAPLAGIRSSAARRGDPVPEIRVDIRTGDTAPADRRRQVKDPAEILVTTPESLYLLLGSQARETLRTVHTVILDEVHALAPTKRGSHLALSLERLSELTEREPQRIGLSATVRPLSEVARWMGGDRDVQIVDASRPPSIDLEVTVPLPDMANPPLPPEEPAGESGGSVLGQLYDRDARPASPERGVWAAILPKIVEEIERRRTTIVFVNSRGLCERLAQRLNDIHAEHERVRRAEDEDGEPDDTEIPDLVRTHHGSLSHVRRKETEELLKEGRIRAIVATSSLELGIDMAAVDHVVLVESPGSVASGLQRIGRAGHGVGEQSQGTVFPKHRGDLLEATVVAERMRRGEIESLQVPRRCLDVLAQQIVAMVAVQTWRLDDLEACVKRASAYRDLSREVLGLLLHVKRELSVPMVFVTHRVPELLALADDCAVLEGGRVVAQGPPLEVLQRPRALGVASLVGVDNLLRLAVLGHDEAGGCTLLDVGSGLQLAAPYTGEAPGTPQDVGFYADEVLLCRESPRGLSARNILPGEVTALDPVGREVLVTLRVGACSLRARLTPAAVRELELESGSAVSAIIKTTSVHYLS